VFNQALAELICPAASTSEV